MIKLTQSKMNPETKTVDPGLPIWVNRNQILMMRRESTEWGEFTSIIFTNSAIDVMETPEEINQLG